MEKLKKFIDSLQSGYIWLRKAEKRCAQYQRDIESGNCAPHLHKTMWWSGLFREGYWKEGRYLSVLCESNLTEAQYAGVLAGARPELIRMLTLSQKDPAGLYERMVDHIDDGKSDGYHHALKGDTFLDALVSYERHVAGVVKTLTEQWFERTFNAIPTRLVPHLFSENSAPDWYEARDHFTPADVNLFESLQEKWNHVTDSRVRALLDSDFQPNGEVPDEILDDDLTETLRALLIEIACCTVEPFDTLTELRDWIRSEWRNLELCEDEGYEPIWGTCWHTRSRDFSADEYAGACGFDVWDDDDTVVLGVNGAGYDFYGAHWTPLYSLIVSEGDINLRDDWMHATPSSKSVFDLDATAERAGRRGFDHVWLLAALREAILYLRSTKEN